MTTREEIGRRVAIARCVAQLTQQALADATGLGRGAITDIETGHRNITATELVPLATVLGRSVGWICGEPTRPQGAPSAGDVLRRTLRTLGIKQAELARRTGLTPKHINQVIKHGVPVSPAVAAAIGEATGIPAEVWIVLDAVYQVQQHAAAEHETTPNRNAEETT